MKWILKAGVQKVISFLPYRNKINYFFQKYVTKGVELSDTYFNYKFEHLLDHLEFYKNASGNSDLSEKICLELGTGWYPIIPVGFFLKGADKTYSVDISPLVTTPSFLVCLDEIIKRENAFLEAFGGGQNIQRRFEFLKQLRQQSNEQTPLADLCKSVNLELKVGDARQLDISPESVHLVTSNNTFEHIYPEILEGIVSKLWQTTAHGGIMSHFIDMSDHFAHFDTSISIYNFLKFSDQQWALIDNPIQPQNRWRFLQYKQLYDKLGIPYKEGKTRPGEPQFIASFPVHSSLKYMSAQELAISHGYLISIKK